jgi:hypothetical protein
VRSSLVVVLEGVVIRIHGARSRDPCTDDEWTRSDVRRRRSARVNAAP